MAQIFLPYAEILRKSVTAPLKVIKDAGFDGIECHLIGSLLSPSRVRKLYKEAILLGLSVRFHQGWSWATGQRNTYNLILRFLGALLPQKLSFEESVRNAGETPIIIYGNRVSEKQKANYVYQTASDYDHRRYPMSFNEFIIMAKSANLSLVFDTEHAIEWALNKENVAELPEKAVIEETVMRIWLGIHGIVKEIHLCDFNPTLGATRGRNVFLGKGIFPLEAFSRKVRESGWDGIVTPEVSPQHLRGRHAIQKLYDKTRELFP